MLRKRIKGENDIMKYFIGEEQVQSRRKSEMDVSREKCRQRKLKENL